MVSCHFLVGLCQIPFLLWEAEGNQLASWAAGTQHMTQTNWKPQPKSLNLGGIIQKSSRQGPHWKVAETLKASVDCMRGKSAPGQRPQQTPPMECTWPCSLCLRLPGFLPIFHAWSSGFPVDPVSHLISSQ